MGSFAGRATYRGPLSLAPVLVGRRALHCQADNLLAAHEQETQRSARLPLGVAAPLLRRKLAELLRVTEHKVHVSVERHEATHELAPVLRAKKEGFRVQ